MKQCSKCRDVKPFSLFSNDKSRKDGLYPQCRECARNGRDREKDSAWRRNNLDKIRAQNARAAERQKAWREMNRARIAAHKAQYRRENRNKAYANTAVYRAKKAGATPAWVNLSDLAAVYAKCAEVSTATGIVHHVDHIIPLNHPLVCGLNVTHNLQIIPASQNLSKSNRFEVS